MSKYISELLGASEPLFSISVTELERGCGNAGVDASLTGEIIAKSNAAIQALGLDVTDTTAEEVYASLQQMTKLHDEFLQKRLWGLPKTSGEGAVGKIIAAISSSNAQIMAWRVKPSVIKRFLWASKPHKTARLLGYRSIDSMLKREPLESVYFAVQTAESSAWRRGFLNRYHKLSSGDFEQNEVIIVSLGSAKYKKLRGKLPDMSSQPVLYAPELGTIAVAPIEEFFKKSGSTLTIFLLLLHKIEEIRTISSYLKHRQFSKNFGLEMQQCLSGGLPYGFMIGRQPLNWRAVHRHLGSTTRTEQIEELGPHMAKEDFIRQKSEEILYRLEPALHFWHGLDYVGRPVLGDKPVSFGLLDNAVCLVRNLTFESRSVKYFQESLQSELCSRYLDRNLYSWHVTKQISPSGQLLAGTI